MTDPHSILKQTFGFDSFRGVQQDVIGRVLAGRHTLAIMPTGAGKSLCYQLPALVRPGTALVISPLIALMHDQIRSANAIGIRAASLTSADTDREHTADQRFLHSAEVIEAERLLEDAVRVGHEFDCFADRAFRFLLA